MVLFPSWRRSPAGFEIHVRRGGRLWSEEEEEAHPSRGLRQTQKSSSEGARGFSASECHEYKTAKWRAEVGV